MDATSCSEGSGSISTTSNVLKKRKGPLLHIHKVGGKEHIMSQIDNLGKENSIASSPLPSFPPQKAADGSRLLISLFFFFSRKPPPL